MVVQKKTNRRGACITLADERVWLMEYVRKKEMRVIEEERGRRKREEEEER